MARNTPAPSPEFFRSLAEASPNALLFIDTSERISYANPRAVTLSGAGHLDDLVGAPVASFLLEEDRARAQQDIAALRADGVRRLAEYRLRRVDGNLFDAQVSVSIVTGPSGHTIGFAAVVLDVTEVKGRETSFQLMFQSNPLAMWVYDPQSLQFLAVNDAAVQQYGYSREEFTSMRITDIRPAEDEERLREHVQGPRADIERSGRWCHRLKDGELREVEIDSSVMKFAGRQARLVVAHDVTEKHRLEQQIRQGQKMDAIGRLAGGIAHDFNNLLTTILGYCDLLVENRALASALKPDVDEIKHAATSAASLTQQLLAFSRKQMIEPKNIDVNDLLNRMGTMIRRLIGENLTVDLRLPPGVLPVRIDPGQFEQIFLNLAVNARDAMPQGGRLLIETANVALDSKYAREHLGVTPGRFVLLTVTDTGEGMSREVQARLFEPFFTTKAIGKGTGMGLATVYGIVKQNNGYISVYSELGQGTTVKVYFPAVLDGSATDNREVNPARQLAGTETILVVEDNDRLRELTRRSLQRQGYTTLLASNGDEAVRIAETHDGTIQLLLTDVVMPGLSGKQLVEAISRVRPDTRILYCSGYTADAIAHHGVVDTGVAFLQKPFTPDSLARKVREVLDA